MSSADLLKRARAQTGKGVTATIREGLELVAAGQVYDRLRALRGKVAFTIDAASASQGPAVIAIDTSSVIAYLSGQGGLDVEATGLALEHRQAVLPPVVLSELAERAAPPLRCQGPAGGIAACCELVDGYWERAGLLRAKTIARKRKAALADVLIAQACLDHDVELVTRDQDFNALAVMAGLRLIPAPARR